MFRVKQARILLPHQLFHHGKHVVLAFVDEHSVAMICPEPLLMSAGGSFGCSASRTRDCSATGTTALRK
jgi:hypothetical protein